MKRGSGHEKRGSLFKKRGSFSRLVDYKLVDYKKLTRIISKKLEKICYGPYGK